MDLTKRSFAGTFFKSVLLGGAIFVALLYTALAARWALQTRAALRTSEADEAGRTAARVIQGVVVESAPTRPPSLPAHVAWMAHLGEWRGGSKNRTYVVTCTVARVDGLRIEDPRTHETFIVDGYQWKAGDFAEGMPFYDPRRVAVDLLRSDAPPIVLNVSSTTVPEPVRTLCAGLLPSDSFDYQERWVELGNALSVRGCASGEKSGNDTVIVPCGDGLDVITASGLAAMRRETRDQQIHFFAFGSLGLVIGLGLLGLFASNRLVKSKRVAGAPT
jgi:type II secretory pathway pseudopilin PulG